MKDVLRRCANLAHLEVCDATKLEADIADMISMAESLSKLEFDKTDDAYAIPLNKLREDREENADGRVPDFTGQLFVPRVSGV